MKLIEIACYVLVPLAWGLAVEVAARRIRRALAGRPGRNTGGAEQ